MKIMIENILKERVTQILRENLGIIYFLLIILGASAGFACSRQVVPGLTPGKSTEEFDQAGFDYRFVEATRQKLLGNMGEALKNFELCIKMDPGSDASYYQMAQIMLNNGDTGNGKKFIRKASELDPGNLWYYVTLAGVYYQEKNIDSAIICYEKVLKYYPEKENIQFSLANLYAENKKYEKARSILDQLEQKYGINENTTLSLIRTMMAEKDFKAARKKTEELIKQNPDNVAFNGLLADIYRSEGENKEAFGIYEELLKKNPDEPALQLALCDFLLSEKNYGELMNAVETAVSNDQVKKEDKVSLIAELTENPDITKEFGGAMESVIKKLEMEYPDDELIVLIRPDFLHKENKLEESALRLEDIIKEHPDNYLGWEKLLLVYYDQKNFKKLEERGKECATKFNRSVLAKILYASAAMENANYDVALEELRKADILAGDNKEIKMQVLTMKADIFYRMKNFEEAFKAFDEALKLNSSDLTVLNNYSYYLAEQDMKLKEAEEMAKEVIHKEKDNNTFLDTYAWVLYKRGKNREAAKVMEKIINSGEKDDAEWYEHYGYILKKMGKCSDAVKKWEKAISIDKSKNYLQKEIENCIK